MKDISRGKEANYDIRTIQDLLGHKNLNTTMIYTHVMNKGAMGVKSPLDGFILSYDCPDIYKNNPFDSNT